MLVIPTHDHAHGPLSGWRHALSRGSFLQSIVTAWPASAER